MKPAGRPPKSDRYLIDRTIELRGNDLIPLSIHREPGKGTRAWVQCRRCRYEWSACIYDLWNDKKYVKCQKCSRIRKTREFIKKYRQSDHVNPNLTIPEQEYSSKGIKIVCREHGEQTVQPSNLIHGKLGCVQCKRKYKLVDGELKSKHFKPIEQVRKNVEESTGGEFVLVSSEYKGLDGIHTFRHEKGCGKTFAKGFRNLLKRRACPFCKRNSIAERTMNNILDSNNIDYIYQWRYKTEFHTHYFDFYLPTYKTLIELQGSQHKPGSRPKGDPWYDKDRPKWDEEKRKIAKKLGLNLLEIDYHDFFPDKMIEILNESGIKCTYDQEEDYTRLLLSKKEVAEYAVAHGHKAATEKYSLASKTVTTYIKLVFGKGLRAIKREKLGNAVSKYYLNHSMRETEKKFHVSQTFVENVFLEKFGNRKSDLKLEDRSELLREDN